jgi:hypothetical protein
LLARTRSIYYGLDPAHPYSDVACPNTLYQALRHRKPLIFFCGGEPADLAGKFRIGTRTLPSVAALASAVEAALTTSAWQFDEAWREVWQRADLSDYVETVSRAATRP